MTELKRPKLKDVSKFIKSNKDTNFLQFFDSNNTEIFQKLRHRYNDVYNNIINGFSHLRLFTKHLKKMIDASQTSADEYLKIVKEYRNEEPTLNINNGGLQHNNNDITLTNINLPDSFNNNNNSESKSDGNIDTINIQRKTDIDAFAEVFEFERRMSILLVTFWNKMNKEVYTPLYLFRKNLSWRIEEDNKLDNLSKGDIKEDII